MTATESDTTASTLAELDEQIERLEHLARLAIECGFAELIQEISRELVPAKAFRAAVR
jgi:hypothetical protein